MMRKEEVMDKTPLYLQVAHRLIEELKKGTAPWQKPWNVQGIPAISMPYNQQTGQRYKGINAINLLLSGFEDPRWLTFKQAESSGFKVNHKAHGSLIQFIKTHQQKSLLDERGNRIYDELGNALYEQELLRVPIISNAWVFNAEQMSGLPALAPNAKEIKWDPVKRAESLIAASGAKVEHKFIDRAYYHPLYDIITMPDRSQFDLSSGYYATLLHELAHWTGHPDRLNRTELMSSGKEAYAKEELRAEIASMLIGDEFRIGHDPSQHTAYIESWVSILEDTPFEIFSAAADAEKIFSFLSSFEQKREISLQNQAGAEKLLTGSAQRVVKYLSTGDEISYNGQIYKIQGHLKQGRLKVEQQPSGIIFTLSKSDQLYHSLSEIKSSLLQTAKKQDSSQQTTSENHNIKR
ncbi:ArdC family protein [Pedobacter sp. HDW13]|uniref:ArdC family protein n=1 Tax=Pedobacter sp. HDW13 TaxID=2714940 RepID=UPI001F0EB5BB|nr:zincin-like metallopeptidase domain-containing protein [Pedobacter sp. HDW13]